MPRDTESTRCTSRRSSRNRPSRSEEGSPTARSSTPIVTAGETFSDGGVLELAGNSDNPERWSLLFWHAGETRVAPQIEFDGRVFVPPIPSRTVARALRLPTRMARYGTARELFNDVCNLPVVVNLDNDTRSKLAFLAFGTWMSADLPLAPLLSLVGPPTAPASAILEILALICRRPILLGHLDVAAFRHLPMQLRPTLLLENPQLSPEVMNLLRASSKRATYVVTGGQLYGLHIPKVVFSYEPLKDPALASRAVQVALPPLRGQLPVLDEKTKEQIADDFQSRFVDYRVRNLPKICPPRFDVGGLTAPMQELARSWGACIVGDEELQATIISLLHEQDGQLRVERTGSFESVVLEGLLFFCHNNDRSMVRVIDLVRTVNAIMEGRGESLQVSPETVGRRLKGLNLFTQKIDSAGMGLVLWEETRRRIHVLARDYDVLSVQIGGRQGCSHCAVFGGM